MGQPPMTSLTLSATDFKATCLELMAAAAARRLDRVTVTKRGKAFVTISFECESGPRPDPFGCMKGSTGLDATNIAELEAELAAIGEEQAALMEASLSRFR
jgi:hypothetical protein